MPDAAAPPATLLVADDDPAVRQSLERTLTREGYAVVLAPDGQAALERLRAGGIDLVLSDLRMPGLTGLEFLTQGKAAIPDVDFILLTAFGTVEEAVKAMKDGAIDFITKPFQRAQLIKVVRQALERRALIAQNRALQQRLEDLLGQGHMIGVSPAFRRMMTLVDQVADSSATVLIQGESGTGKEGVAKSLHERSSRRAGPFVAVNCAALPETLLESRAVRLREGRVHRRGRAQGGSLRAGRRRHALPGRDGGPLAGDPAEDLAGAAGGRVRARGRHPDEPRGRAHRHRHESGPRRARAREALSRGSVLPPERHHHRRAAAARPPGGHSRPRPALPAHLRREEQPAPRRLLGGGARLPRGLCVARQRARARERGGARGGARPGLPRRDGGAARQRRRPIGDDRSAATRRRAPTPPPPGRASSRSSSGRRSPRWKRACSRRRCA